MLLHFVSLRIVCPSNQKVFSYVDLLVLWFSWGPEGLGPLILVLVLLLWLIQNACIKIYRQINFDLGAQLVNLRVNLLVILAFSFVQKPTLLNLRRS